jgi:formylglycine-generating enzyme required for sulfatase activity
VKRVWRHAAILGAVGFVAWSVARCTPKESVPAPPGAGTHAGSNATAGSGGSASSSGGTDGGTGAGIGAGSGAVPEECSVGTPGSSDASDPFPDCEHPEVVPNCKDGWCEIPAGCFVMGSPESEWGHPANAETELGVTLTRAFLIQQTEVTIEQWTAAGLPMPAYAPDSDGLCPHAGFPCGEPCLEPSCPVASVSWFEAAAYANLLSERHEPPLEPCYRLSCEGPTEACYPNEQCQGEVGKDFLCSFAEVTSTSVYDCEGYRLPTSAEWEYAARAGTKTAYYSGSNLGYGEYAQCSTYCQPDPNLERIGWYCYDSGGRAHPVGELLPNAWGLYDVAGNVYEWIHDKMDGLSAQSPTDPVVDDLAHPSREMRGGAYNLWAGQSRLARPASSTWNSRGSVLGVRLVRTLR